MKEYTGTVMLVRFLSASEHSIRIVNAKRQAYRMNEKFQVKGYRYHRQRRRHHCRHGIGQLSQYSVDSPLTTTHWLLSISH